MGLTPELRKAIEAKSVERQIDDPEFCGVNKGEHLAFIAGAEACFEIMQAENQRLREAPDSVTCEKSSNAGESGEFPLADFNRWVEAEQFTWTYEVSLEAAKRYFEQGLASRPKAEGRELTIKVRKAPEGGFAFLYEAVELNQFVNDGKIVEQDVRFREVLERGE